MLRRHRPFRSALLGLVAAATGLAPLVVAPAPALAAETLQVSLVPSTTQAGYGDEVGFTATVTSGGVPVFDVFVGLVRTGPDGATDEIDAWYTDEAGVAPLTDTPPGRSTYVATADTGVDTGTSAVVSVDVAYRVLPTVSPAAVPPGGVLSLRGTVDPVLPGAAVTVEQRVGAGAFTPLGLVPVNADGTWTFALGPRTALGDYTLRATIPADATLSAGVGESVTRVTVTGAGNAKAWRPVAGTRSQPARWGTCRIGYRVNPRRMPATGLADLREAMRRVTMVSGLRFRYLGGSSSTPTARYGGPGRNKMLVAWAPPARSGGLISGSVAGVGGTSRTGSRLLSGFLLMNSDYSTGATPGFGAGQPLGLVLMHELGHVVGLGHSPDRRQIMASGVPLPASVWGAADLRGLRAVGARCR